MLYFHTEQVQALTLTEKLLWRFNLPVSFFTTWKFLKTHSKTFWHSSLYFQNIRIFCLKKHLFQKLKLKLILLLCVKNQINLEKVNSWYKKFPFYLIHPLQWKLRQSFQTICNLPRDFLWVWKRTLGKASFMFCFLS